MSRDAYVGGSRSPRGVRLPTVDRSPSRAYPGGSPLGRKPVRQTRSGNNSPDHTGYTSYHSYYRDEDLEDPMLEERGRTMSVGTTHHRSRSATRPTNPMSVRYQSLDRGPTVVDHDREFLPIRDRRDRSLERGLYFEDDPYISRSARQSPTSHQPFIGELQHQNSDLQRDLANLKKELDLTNQKLGSSMHSIKTFWSPELKKERALRKEESAKYSLINDQLKLLSSENQKQAMLVRQLEEELRMRMRGPSVEVQQQMEALYQENEHLQREIAILRDTIKELELRIETQKQTLQARDESIKKLLEMLQNKGMGKEEERAMFQQMQAMAQKQELQAANETLRTLQSQLELVPSPSSSTIKVLLDTKDARIATLEREVQLLEHEIDRLAPPSLMEPPRRQLDEFRVEIQRRDQEILAMGAKMKTLEEQHQDYQRHIAVLKESLCAKEEHYNMLQADVEELRARLDEKNRMIEKKQQQHQQDRARAGAEISEIREHMDIKDRKINVLQRKLELHEATKKLQMAPQRPAEDLSGQRKQLDDERRKIEEVKRQLEEQKRSAETKHRQVEEKERQLAELDRQLQKQQQQMDQLQSSLQKAGGTAAAATELTKKLTDAEKKVEKAQEEAKRSATEMERLLQLVQMSQEEQNQKEKQIMELQQALKNAQTKLKQTQQAQTQENEIHERTELDLRNQKEAISLQLDLAKNQFKEQRTRLEALELEVEAKDEIILRLNNGDKNNNDGVAPDDKNLISNGISKRLSRNDCGNVDKTKQRSEIDDYAARIGELEGVIEDKEGRILQLEDGLRESVQISTEREHVLQKEETKRRQIMQKVGKLEQRLLSLQSAQAMRCHNCKPYVRRTCLLEEKLLKLIAERRKNLQELAHMKREALEAAISEKDSHLAILEMTGIRNARQAEEADNLKLDKKRLVEMLKKEAESSISLLEESEIEDELSLDLIKEEQQPEQLS